MGRSIWLGGSRNDDTIERALSRRRGSECELDAGGFASLAMGKDAKERGCRRHEMSLRDRSKGGCRSRCTGSRFGQVE